MADTCIHCGGPINDGSEILCFENTCEHVHNEECVRHLQQRVSLAEERIAGLRQAAETAASAPRRDWLDAQLLLGRALLADDVLVANGKTKGAS